MSRVFLSHSSRDSRQALALHAWLVDAEPGLASEIFLDLDRETGIAAGTRWKDAQPVGDGLPTETDVSTIAFSPDGTTLAAGGIDGGIWSWDIESGEQLGAALIGNDVQIDGIDFSPYGSRLLSTSVDGTIRIWPVSTSDPKALCAKLIHNMSQEQWDEWVSPDIPYVPVCSAFQARCKE
jgi:WD40 repeat protein